MWLRGKFNFLEVAPKHLVNGRSKSPSSDLQLTSLNKANEADPMVGICSQPAAILRSAFTVQLLTTTFFMPQPQKSNWSPFQLVGLFIGVTALYCFFVLPEMEPGPVLLDDLFIRRGWTFVVSVYQSSHILLSVVLAMESKREGDRLYGQHVADAIQNFVCTCSTGIVVYVLLSITYKSRMVALHGVAVAPKLKWHVFEVVAIISSALGFEYLVIRFALWLRSRQSDSLAQSLPVDGIEEEKRLSEEEKLPSEEVKRSSEAKEADALC